MSSYIQGLCIGGLFLLASCGDDTKPVTYPPIVTTGVASDIYREGVTLSGSIQNNVDADITGFGILYSDHQGLAEPDTVKAVSADASSFSVTLKGLRAGTTYYYCAYASSGFSVSKGEIKTFNTTVSNPPVVGEAYCVDKNERGFSLKAVVEDLGDDHTLQLCGFCWKENSASAGEPTLADESIFVDADGMNFSAKVTGLAPNKTYLVRAFAGNSVGVGYSQTFEVTTQRADKPVLSNITVEATTSESITVRASVLNPEAGALESIGFCWTEETTEPTMESNTHQILDEQLGASSFAYTITGLKPETVYYIRAYARNEHGEDYSEVCEVKTLAVTVPEATPGNGGIDDLPTGGDL